VGLLVLQRLLSDFDLLDLAVRLGDELLDAAETEGDTRSWPGSGVQSSANLTGFSHGTAGIGYALTELARTCGDERYLRAAEAAFAYEEAVFDARTANWPDFRTLGSSPRSQREARRNGAVAGGSFWCHGAPGIALSRLRVSAQFSDRRRRSEAEIAISTTAGIVNAMLESGVANYSLCHGLIGNAEILAEATRGDVGVTEELESLVVAVADSGCAAYAIPGRQWPCGTLEGESPGLFLGLAGIGRFYLRLEHPNLPLLTMLKPEEFPDSH
jgi:lantibiotic biosynthesis protein